MVRDADTLATHATTHGIGIVVKDVCTNVKALAETVEEMRNEIVCAAQVASERAEMQTSSLLSDLRELRALFLANVTRPLTVREAQLCNVCRVCRGKPGAPFLLEYGKEFAHPKCLEGD